MANMLTIPREILKEIFNYVYLEELSSLLLTCKNFYDICLQIFEKTKNQIFFAAVMNNRINIVTRLKKNIDVVIKEKAIKYAITSNFLSIFLALIDEINPNIFDLVRRVKRVSSGCVISIEPDVTKTILKVLIEHIDNKCYIISCSEKKNTTGCCVKTEYIIIEKNCKKILHITFKLYYSGLLGIHLEFKN